MRRLATLLLTVIVVAGCSSSAEIGIDDGWARTSAGMQNAGAAYMTITGGEADDKLISVSVPDSIAGMAQIHETTMADDGSGNQMMSMEQVPEIAIPAGSEVNLEPGGYHVMMMNLTNSLVEGQEFVVTLTFETAGDIEVSVTVKDEG